MRPRKGRKKPRGMPIPTQRQLESLLVPNVFKKRLEMLGEFLGWLNQIRDGPLPFDSHVIEFLQFIMHYKFNKSWDPKKEKWYSNSKTSFKINESLSLRLERNKTNIYINNKRFKQCKFLLFNIKNQERKNYKDIDSIDEVSEIYDKTHETDHATIDPETEFWGHCSNLQAWYENDYDTRILHSNLAFPLLNELTRAGDPLAKKIFKEEIALRLESEYLPVFQYLIRNYYLDNFTKEELKIISKNLSHPILRIFIKHYFSFKKIGAHLVWGTINYGPRNGNQEIFISHNNFGIEKGIPKEKYSQESIINLSDWKTSLKNILFFSGDKYYYRFLYYSRNKNPIEKHVRKDLIKLSHEILGKNSKCVISLIRFNVTTPNRIEFFSIKKKIRIYISLEIPKEG